MADMRPKKIVKKGIDRIAGSIKEGYVCLQQIINDKKMRTKIVYLYIFCALIPVIVTNMIIIGITLQASVKQRNESINNIVDSVAKRISSSFENAAYIGIDLYASNSITSFLDNQYHTNSEFFEQYQQVFENYVFYSSSKYLIQDITLYSDNDTMINGGRYYRIDSIRNKEWYQRFEDSGQEFYIYSYFNESEYPNAKKRMISVIRRINFYGRPDVEKLVKMDLNYGRITKMVKEAAYDTTVYVTSGDKILFSNKDSNKTLKEGFENLSAISLSDMDIHKTYTSYGYDFDVYLMDYKSNYLTMIRERAWILIVILLADALLPIFVLVLVGHSITERVLVVGKHLNNVNNESFQVIRHFGGKDEIGEMIVNYNLMVHRMENLIEFEYKSKLEKQSHVMARQQAELLALYSQINPHFMFNVLETIRMRSVIKNEQETSQMIESLAKLMRKSAEWGSDLITLEKEIDFAKDYLKLQKYRFGDAFLYRTRIPESCKDFIVPSLSLVTFVENACVHGLNREGHSGLVIISAYEEDGYLHIEIEDTGIGMEEEQVVNLEKLLNRGDILDLQKTASLGMLNASIRLKKYCNEKTQIMIESEKNIGTCIIIRIPIEQLNYNKEEVYE